MTEDRDAIVTGALRELPVPDHAPDFWANLERRLAGESIDRPVGATRRGVPPWASTTPPGRTDDLGPDDDTVVALSERRPVTPRRRRLLSVAAVLLVVSAAVATFAREQEAPRVRVAGPGIPTATSTTPTTSGPVTTLATPTTDAGPGAPTPDAALLAWIDAVGAGD
ncbi:MAG TPA: hypothetical protein VM933_06220, partial [Acidimicrobiales bacterium]|nr:hypothetical protein [Acidimicrobiales bacterium]